MNLLQRAHLALERPLLHLMLSYAQLRLVEQARGCRVVRLQRLQHTSAYVSIRQHASAYVIIRQHT